MNTKLVRYLTLSAILSLPMVSSADPGQELWMKHCKKCHGDDGKGQTAMGTKLGIRDYSDPAVQATFTDEELVQVIKDGKTDESGKKLMLAFGGKLSDEEIQALVAHVRSLKAE